MSQDLEGSLFSDKTIYVVPTLENFVIGASLGVIKNHAAEMNR